MNNSKEICQQLNEFSKLPNLTSVSFNGTEVINKPIIEEPLAAPPSKDKTNVSNYSLLTWDRLLGCLCDFFCQTCCKYECDWGNCCETVLLCNCNNCNI